MEVQELYDMLEARRRELGLSQTEVEDRAFGRSGNAALQRIRRGSAPAYDRLMALGAALDLEFYFGPRRKPQSTGKEIEPDFVMIPRYDFALSAGPGATIGENFPSSALAFRADWLASIGLKPASCVVVNVTGDSMEPTLSEGDLVMLDRTSVEIKDMAMFGIVDEDGTAKVKRLQKLEHQLILHSDNRAYGAEMRSERDANQMTIIGQVVWSGHYIGR